MIIISIIGILAIALSAEFKPYIARSRDTKRTTDILNYMNQIISTYEKTYDTFPSNYWSGGNSNALWYCLSELPTRTDIITPWWASGNDGHFTALSGNTSMPPVDSLRQIVLPSLCSMSWSYVYSRFRYSASNEVAIIAARLESRSSANYWTGVDLTNSGKIQEIINAKRSTVPNNAPDQLFIVTALH